jgi:ATP-dependent RNA helicase RhlE
MQCASDEAVAVSDFENRAASAYSQASPAKGMHLTDFQALGLSNMLLKSVQSLGFETPTPIQSKAIPLLLEGRDIMGLAQTGTGKTAAFGLPLIHRLIEDKGVPAPKSVRALILAPTRELVNQIADNLRDYVRHSHLRISTVVGGNSISAQIRNMSRGTDILVATPGRLIDLVTRRAVFLDKATYLVLDEADQMLDLGFIHALRRIAQLVGTPRQTMLFSATMPKQIEELSRAFLTDPVRIEVSPSGTTVEEVRQSVHFTGQRNKVTLLNECLSARLNDRSIVFVRTKHGAEKLMKQLVDAGFAAGSIHGNKSQGQRQRAIAAFRSEQIRILVATDVAARGIDISGVSHVYNFDLPEVAENYVHRIGRTARAGADGEAVAFCGPADQHLLREIEKLMGLKIAVASGEPGGYQESRGKPSGGRGRPGNRPRAERSGGGNGEAREFPRKRNGKPPFQSRTASEGGEKRGGPSKPRNHSNNKSADAGNRNPMRSKKRGQRRSLAAA